MIFDHIWYMDIHMDMIHAYNIYKGTNPSNPVKVQHGVAMDLQHTIQTQVVIWEHGIE